MEPGPSGSRSGGGGGGGSSGGGTMPERAVQQIIVNPVPGPSLTPHLAQPVQVPPHFLVPPEKLLPHQVRSGIDIGNLFKLLNTLQNRIAVTCGQHQFLRDPLNQPRPPENGGYKPATPQGAVKYIRSLCIQQRNLMEKLRRWNCTNDGKCYDLVTSGKYSGICTNCEPFAASRIRMKRVNKALRKQRAKARRKAFKKLTSTPTTTTKSKQQPKKKVAVTVSPKPHHKPLFPSPSQPPRKRRKTYVNPEPPHPETFLSQENFLSELGLVTPEVYQKTQAESRRTERRRRTTANPKYKSKVSVDPNEAGKCKRSRRSDPSSLEVPHSNTLSSPTGAERRRAKQKRYECTVCEKKDVTIQCSGCLSGFHPECIRVTASKAPPPTTVPVCPNCVSCDPSIRSSDCILLSRRMSRPSIMGLKSDPEPRSSGNNRHSNSLRNQKATSRRKATAKNFSKAARRNASSAKSKKLSFKPQSVSKPRKPTQSTKKSYSKRTLNHSLAVAAAAAVPAYCTSARSSEESTSAQEKASGYQQPIQRKRKLDVPTADDSKLYKGKHTPSPAANDRRGQCMKRETSSTPLSATKGKETAVVKKSLQTKPLPLVQLDERSNCVSKKNATKPKEVQDGVVLSQKNSPTNGCIQTFPPGGSKTVALASQQKVDANGRIKKTKLEKMEENIIPMESSEGQTPAKGTTGKNKKGTGSKSGPVDPFCMKRTMMAMSAAAGIVLSNSGIKMSNTSNTTPPPPSVATSMFNSQKVVDSGVKSTFTQDISSNSNHEIDSNNVTTSTEAKTKVVNKLPKATMLSPLANLSNNVCENEVGKFDTISQDAAGHVWQKSSKPTIISQPPPTNMDNSPSEKEMGKSTPKTFDMLLKTAQMQKSVGYSPSAPVNNAREANAKAYLFKPNSKGKSIQIPKPAIISQLAALKNKCMERGVSTEALRAQETKKNCDTNTVNTPPSSLAQCQSLSMPISKPAAGGITLESNGKITQSSPKTTIISNSTPVKAKPVEKGTKKKDGFMEQKVKTIQKSPISVSTTQVSPKIVKVGDKEMNKKEATAAKAKKVPKPKLDPATEQSISDTINRVILEATSAVDKDEQDSKDNINRTEYKNSEESSSHPAIHRDHEGIGNLKEEYKASSIDKWKSNLASNEFNFSYADFSLNDNENGIPMSANQERSASPASNSSTIGSPRSLRDLESDDSSDDLLSIPDTPLAPYLELKRLEKPGPYLDLSALDRLEHYSKNPGSAPASKRGRAGGRGRGGRH